MLTSIGMPIFCIPKNMRRIASVTSATSYIMSLMVLLIATITIPRVSEIALCPALNQTAPAFHNPKAFLEVAGRVCIASLDARTTLAGASRE